MSTKYKMRVKKKLSKGEMSDFLRCDFEEWCRWRNRKANIFSFLKFFIRFPEYRYLVGVRLRMGGNSIRVVVPLLIKISQASNRRFTW